MVEEPAPVQSAAPVESREFDPLGQMNRDQVVQHLCQSNIYLILGATTRGGFCQPAQYAELRGTR